MASQQNVIQNIEARFFFYNYIFEKMTCSLAASMQEVKIFSEHILKNRSVWTSYYSLCCVLRTISHANYWMQSWYVAQLTHLYNRNSILQSYVSWVSCLFSPLRFFSGYLQIVFIIYFILFSAHHNQLGKMDGQNDGVLNHLGNEASL